MIAEIIKILPPKKSRDGKNIYYRIEFKEIKKGKWYKTDLVCSFRNFKRWQKYLREGNILANLRLKDEETIDADSKPILIKGRRKLNTGSTIEQLSKLGVFG